ncbi:MAG: energy-coupling factor ABC transporter permease [Pseudomonadota bacterium]|nr:energy-coupling factor ABC transporter permease [Pseudomonadota bacterium]MEC7823755.1 energy-coupling factor ABC transporter permease [Pseudomonadota bacterium]
MTTLQLVGLAGFVLLLAYIVRHIDWQALVANKQKQHMLFGCAAAVFFLWVFRASVPGGPSPSVHFMWLVALALILGFRFSIIAATLALLGVTIVGKESWAMLGVNGLLGVAAPIAFGYLIFMLAFHKLPRNLFIYIFMCAFLPGALAIALKIALMSGYYVMDDVYTWSTVKDSYLILIPLLLFPEGMLNGMTMTILIIYFPGLAYTFHDKFYIDGK